MNKDDQEFFSRIKKGADNKHFILLSKRKVPSVPPLHQQDIKNDKVMKMIDKRLAYWDKVKEDFRREFGYSPKELVVFPIRGFTATMWATGTPLVDNTPTLSWNEEPTEEPIPDYAVKCKCYGYSVIIGYKTHQFKKEEVSKKYIIDFLKKYNDFEICRKFINPLLGSSAFLFYDTIMSKMVNMIGPVECSWTAMKRK